MLAWIKAILCDATVDGLREGNEMIIPLSSPRAPQPGRRTTPNAAVRSHGIQYMKTALAVQLLPDDDHDDLPNGKMGLLEHLEELRRRIIRSCIAIGLGMVVAFVFNATFEVSVIGLAIEIAPFFVVMFAPS